MAAWKTIGAVAGLSLGLTGCASDPAFWEGLAEGLDTLAYELENQPVCTWYTDRFGAPQQYCQPAWQASQPIYVAPVYVPPRYVDRDRHDRRDRRGHRERRDHDRDGDRRGRKH